MERRISFGNWVRRRRKSLDLTQQELANQVGCSKVTIVKIEADERRPSRQLAELLAQRLNICSEELSTFLQVSRLELNIDKLEDSPLQINFSQLPQYQIELPVPRTPFIGRQREIAEINRILQDPQCRLLTLAGLGGIGKTRLALTVASQRNERLPDSACFVSLASVISPYFFLPSIADALGFPASSRMDLKSQVCNYLQDKDLLLVLDNMEHLFNDSADTPGSTAVIAEILDRAPRLRILTTSRERLNMPGEWVFEVQGLPIPVSDQSIHLDNSSAIALFLQTAQRISPRFSLETENRADIVKICHIVDGMPLAIELAAAWTRALSCKEIAEEIERGYEFLASNAREIPSRHRSIRATLDHSWNLLSNEEKEAVARLSVFQGGFNRHAAAFVSEISLILLSALVDKSLIRHSWHDRFDMHELVRQYAADRLHEMSGVEQTTRLRHSQYYLNDLYARQATLMNRHQQEMLTNLTMEIDNLRIAWKWAVDQKQLELLRKTTWPLGYFYELRNHFQEGETLFQYTIEKISSSNSQEELNQETQIILAHLQAVQAFFIFRQGRIREAQTRLCESITQLSKWDDQAALADVLWIAGYADWFAGEFQTALEHFQQSYTLTQSLNLEYKSSINAIFVGSLEHELGHYYQAKKWLLTALEQGQSLGDPRVISFAISFLSRTAHLCGETEQLDQLLTEGLRLAQETGDRFMIGLASEQLAQLKHRQGERLEAEQLVQQSLSLFEEIEDLWSLSRALVLAGNFALEHGELSLAANCYFKAFQIAQPACLTPHALLALAGYTRILIKEGYYYEARLIAEYIRQQPASAAEILQQAEKMQVQTNEFLTVQQMHAIQNLSTGISISEMLDFIPHKYTHQS